MASYECRGKNKLWTVRFQVIENGKEVNKRLSGYPRKKDAEQAYRDFIVEYNETLKKISPNTDVLERHFKDIFEEFKAYKKQNLKESSYYDLIKLCEKHILPYFAKLRIKQINKLTVLNWQQSLSEYSYRYKCKMRVSLHSIFKFLYLYYDVDNVVDRVENFKKPIEKKEMLIWTYEDFNKFIETFTEEKEFKYKTFFTMLYLTGCRFGEIVSINYNDIDLNTKTLNIDKSLSSKSFKSNYVITTPKNQSSIRKIILPNKLIDILKEYIEKYPECKNSKFFFGIDKPFDDHTIYRRLEEHVNLAEIKKIRIHDFRHSHASLLIEKGANVVLVAKRLGHTNTEQTLNTYAHLFPNTEKELIDKLNKL